MTGSAFAPAGRHRLSVRQSSLIGWSDGVVSPGMRTCGQSLPNTVAARTPLQRGNGCGARQRSGPTGGRAYGMPINALIPRRERPWSTPAGASAATGVPSIVLAAVQLVISGIDRMVRRARRATVLHTGRAVGHANL